MLLSPHVLRRLARWLLGAMLLATLAPAISRSLNASREAGDWVEICSGTSMRWVQLGAVVGAAATDISEDAQLHVDSCAHCLLSADRFAPLIPAVPFLVGSAPAWAAPVHRGSAEVPVSAPSPSSRGPPLLF